MTSEADDASRTIIRLRADLERLDSEIAEKTEEKKLTQDAITALERLRGPQPEIATETKAPPRTTHRKPTFEECPLTIEERVSLGDKYIALYAIARAIPDRVIHVRTACRWLIEAGLIPDNMDNARVSLTSHMRRRPNIWEQVVKGTFQLIASEEQAQPEAPENVGETMMVESFFNDNSSFTQ